jgi:hypothetical protein
MYTLRKLWNKLYLPGNPEIKAEDTESKRKVSIPEPRCQLDHLAVKPARR